jgi:hypothetical protein
LECRERPRAKRPVYFNDPECDKLLAIIMAVAGELVVTRERLDTLERIASAKGLLSLADIEEDRPAPAAATARDKWRAEYLDRILRIVHHELESIEKGETSESYQERFSRPSRLRRKPSTLCH